MSTPRGRFGVGQLVSHRLFNYRGVVVDVDPTFHGGGDWYETMARTRPPKDKPWYHIIVHNANHRTYVAERNLEPDESGQPINHPEINMFFAEFRDGRYISDRAVN